MKLLTAALIITSMTLLSCPPPDAEAQRAPQVIYNGQVVEMNCENIEHGMSTALGAAKAFDRIMVETDCKAGDPRCVSEVHLQNTALSMFNYLDEMRRAQCAEV